MPLSATVIKGKMLTYTIVGKFGSNQNLNDFECVNGLYNVFNMFYDNLWHVFTEKHNNVNIKLFYNHYLQQLFFPLWFDYYEIYGTVSLLSMLLE